MSNSKVLPTHLVFLWWTLKHKPHVGRNVYGNERLLVDRSEKRLELQYVPRGWDGAPAHFVIGIPWWGRIIIKLRKRWKFLEPYAYDHFRINGTGFYPHMDLLFLLWRGKQRLWYLPFVHTYQVKREYLSSNRKKWIDKELFDKKNIKLNRYTKVVPYTIVEGEKTMHKLAQVTQERVTWKTKWVPSFFNQTSIEVQIDFSNDPVRINGKKVYATSATLLEGRTMVDTFFDYMKKREVSCV